MRQAALRLLYLVAVPGWQAHGAVGVGGGMGTGQGGPQYGSVIDLLTNDKLLRWESRIIAVKTSTHKPNVNIAGVTVAELQPGEYVRQVVVRESCEVSQQRPPQVLWDCQGGTSAGGGIEGHKRMLECILASSARFGVVDEDPLVRSLAWQVVSVLLPAPGAQTPAPAHPGASQQRAEGVGVWGGDQPMGAGCGASEIGYRGSVDADTWAGEDAAGLERGGEAVGKMLVKFLVADFVDSRADAARLMGMKALPGDTYVCERLMAVVAQDPTPQVKLTALRALQRLVIVGDCRALRGLAGLLEAAEDIVRGSRAYSSHHASARGRGSKRKTLQEDTLSFRRLVVAMMDKLVLRGHVGNVMALSFGSTPPSKGLMETFGADLGNLTHRSRLSTHRSMVSAYSATTHQSARSGGAGQIARAAVGGLPGLLPDDESLHVVTAGADGFIRIWDTHTRKQVNFAGGLLSESALEEGTKSAWEMLGGMSGEEDEEDEGLKTRVEAALMCMAVSPGNKFVAAGEDAVDPAEAEAVAYAAKPLKSGKRPRVPTGGRVLVWDGATLELTAALDQEGGGHEAGAGVTCLAWDPSGEMLASGGEDGQIILWATRTWKKIASLQGLSGMVLCCAFVAAPLDAQQKGLGSLAWCLMSGSYQGDLQVWPLAALSVGMALAHRVELQATPYPSTPGRAQQEKVTGRGVGGTEAGGGGGGGGTSARGLISHRSQRKGGGVTFRAEDASDEVLAALRDLPVALLKLCSRALDAQVASSTHRSDISGLSGASEVSKELLIDRIASILRSQGLAGSMTFLAPTSPDFSQQVHRGAVTNCRIAASSLFGAAITFATCSADSTSPIKIWRMELDGSFIPSAQLTLKLPRATWTMLDTISCVDFDPILARGQVAAGRWDGSLIIYGPSKKLSSLPEYQVLAVLEPPSVANRADYKVLAVRYSGDGQMLVSAGSDGVVRVWNPSLYEQVAVLEGDMVHVECILTDLKSSLSPEKQGEEGVNQYGELVESLCDELRELADEPEEGGGLGSGEVQTEEGKGGTSAHGSARRDKNGGRDRGKGGPGAQQQVRTACVFVCICVCARVRW